ncbi:MAG: NAD(P)-binding domain-containing protein [Acidobacteria bacterium]|nr:NAD(P)-binding domain-containing protein [Acidobacteriota bacterium]
MALDLDLLIVGAGPAGISTAVEARRAGIERLMLLEKGPSHSWSIEKLYTPGKRVDKVYLGQEVDCDGAVCIIDGTRETALATLDAFVAQYDLPIQYATEVERIDTLEGGGFRVRDTRGDEFLTRTIVIAIGVFGRPNKPDYPLPGSLKGHVHFDLNHGIPAGESVLIIGGGNTALEYAAYLYADHPTTLAYRGHEFAKANEVNRQILSDLDSGGKLGVWLGADVAGLRDTSTAPRVEVTFKDGRVEAFDHVLYGIGGSTPEGFLKAAGVMIDGKSPVVDERFHTTVPGLYLAGDLVAGGKGSIVKAFNTGHRVVWEGLCQDHLECRIPEGFPGARRSSE